MHWTFIELNWPRALMSRALSKLSLLRMSLSNIFRKYSSENWIIRDKDAKKSLDETYITGLFEIG